MAQSQQHHSFDNPVHFMLEATGDSGSLPAMVALVGREDWTQPVASPRRGSKNRAEMDKQLSTGMDIPDEHPVWAISRIANCFYAPSVEERYERSDEPGQRAWQKLLTDGPKSTGNTTRDARACAAYLKHLAWTSENEDSSQLLLKSVVALEMIAGGCPVDVPFLKGGAAGLLFPEHDCVRLLPVLVFLLRDGGPLAHRRDELAGMAISTVGQTNDAELLQFFLDMAYSPNAQDVYGRTALARAADVQSVKVLLDKGADPALRCGDLGGRTIWDEWRHMAKEQFYNRPNPAMLRRMERAITQSLARRTDAWGAWATVPGVGPRVNNSWARVDTGRVLPFPEGDHQAPSVRRVQGAATTVQCLPVIGAFLRAALMEDTLGLNGSSGSLEKILKTLPANDDPVWEAPFARGVWMDGGIQLLSHDGIVQQPAVRDTVSDQKDWNDGTMCVVSQREALQAVLLLMPAMNKSTPFGFPVSKSQGRTAWKNVMTGVMERIIGAGEECGSGLVLDPDRAPRVCAVVAQALAHVRGGWPAGGVGGTLAHFAASSRWKPDRPNETGNEQFDRITGVLDRKSSGWIDAFRNALVRERRAAAIIGHHAGVIGKTGGMGDHEWLGGNLLCSADLVLSEDVNDGIKVSLGTALLVPFCTSGDQYGFPGMATYDIRHPNPDGMWNAWMSAVIDNPAIFSAIPKKIIPDNNIISGPAAVFLKNTDFPNGSFQTTLQRVRRVAQALREREMLLGVGENPTTAGKLQVSVGSDTPNIAGQGGDFPAINRRRM